MEQYFIVLGKVKASDPLEHTMLVTLDSGDPSISKISLDTKSSWLFMQPHSPRIKNVPLGGAIGNRDLRTGDEDALNFIAGFINYPSVGDWLVLGVFLEKPPGSNRYMSQVTFRPVIVFGQLAREQSKLNKYDNILMDRSGAKIHFNHGWLDGKNVIELDKVTNPVPTGHLTIIGNRMVTLSGRKFLGFGGYSHILQREIEKDAVTNNPEIHFVPGFDNEIVSKDWKEVFTRNITENIFDPDFSKGTQPLGSDKFLEPPCPLPEEDMKMHDSGWKRLIREDASEQRFIHSRMELIGSSFKNLAFAPDNQQADGTAISTGFDATERSTIHDHATEGMVSHYYYDGTNYYGQRIKNGLQDVVMDGFMIDIPTAKKTKVSEVETAMVAVSGKYIIKVGARTLTIDGSTVNVS